MQDLFKQYPLTSVMFRWSNIAFVFTLCNKKGLRKWLKFFVLQPYFGEKLYVTSLSAYEDKIVTRCYIKVSGGMYVNGEVNNERFFSWYFRQSFREPEITSLVVVHNLSSDTKGSFSLFSVNSGQTLHRSQPRIYR